MSRSEGALSGEGWPESPEWLARARRLGPLRYSDLGPRRLSPVAEDEISPLGAWIAGAADRWWDGAGRPDPFTLVVVSGDEGRLARAVLDAAPACAPSLRYVLVDPGRAGNPEPPPGVSRLVALEEPAFLYPAASPGGPDAYGSPDGDTDLEAFELDLDAGERPPARGIGPLATYLTEVPALGDNEGALVAVSLLSRLPYELFERTGDGWSEVRLAATDDRLVELTVPAADDAPRPPMPARFRWRRLSGAAAWLRRQLPTASAGTLAVIDHWASAGDADTLDIDQLRHVREPLETAPRPVEGTSLSVVSWRLG